MKNKLKKNEEGSAIILAILVLAFFMALSMNMFFLAQKKSERAGVKAKGVKVLSNIDGGASIGYYELSRASSAVTNGVARKTTTGSFIVVTTTIPAISTITPSSVYTGVVMEKYQQYFGGFLDTSRQPVVGGFVDTTTTAAVFHPERTSDKESAMWFDRASGSSTTSAITELWTTEKKSEIKDDTASIGGFRIKREGTNRKLTLNGAQTDRILSTMILTNATIIVTYIKTLNIPDGNLTYSIECTRRVVYDNNAAVTSDDLTEIIVLFQ